MYIISTSFIVEPDVHAQWYEFFTQKFLPYVKEIGFKEIIFTRVLTNDNNAHYTYSLQLPNSNMDDYHNFVNNGLEEYRKVAEPWFEDRALLVVSLLKKIEL